MAPISRTVLLAALAALAGCSADTSPSSAMRPDGTVSIVRPGDAGTPPGDGSPSDPDAAAAPSVSFTSPADGASFSRSTVVAAEWVAPVSFHVTSTGVARVELVAAGTSIGDADATGMLAYDFHGDGDIVVDAIGRDAAGTERARDSITIHVTPPLDTGCHAMLDALGLDWAIAAPEHGIADPVRVQPVIHGVTYRYETSTTPTAMLMDCQLAPRLARLSDLVSTYGIVEIEHIGIYNYRCIGGGNPDTDGCTPSMHARAMAIDLHAFIFADRSEYNVETDFVITRTHDSCPMVSSSEADRVLKELACTMVADRIFQIVLTPNYNADHRNHFHVDLTEGSMYLGTGAWGLDPVGPPLGD
jgi:hypothetical protein